MKKSTTIVSWNVNGLRAVAKKGALHKLFTQTNPDLVFLMETKCEWDQLDPSITEIPGYRFFLNPSQVRRGHSGTGVYVRDTLDADISTDTVLEPYLVAEIGATHIGHQEGRLITVELPNLVFVGCYFPNGADRKMEHGVMDGLQYKLEFHDACTQYMEHLRQKQGGNIVIAGDINIAHHPIDIARPESNKNSIGFLPIERAKLDHWGELGWTDIFRAHNPESIVYSWWDVITRARERNVGWRIDAAWCPTTITSKTTVEYFTDYPGSDHCPLVVTVSA